jgi:hypothetical protein
MVAQIIPMYGGYTHQNISCLVSNNFDTRNRKCWSIPFRYLNAIRHLVVTNVDLSGQVACVF